MYRKVHKTKKLAVNWLLSLSIFFTCGFNLKVSANEKAIKIPFAIRDGFIFLETKIQEKNYSLLFDLGDFRQISVSEKVLKDVEYEETGDYDTFTDYKGKTFKAKKILLPEIRLGEFQKQQVIGSIDIFDPENPTPSPDGAIGAALFSDHTLLIDYSESNLIVDSKIFPATCSVFSKLDYAMILSPVVEGRTYTFLLDTGSQQSLIRNELAFKKNSRDGVPVHTFDVIRLGDKQLSDAEFVSVDLNIPGVDGIIGQDILSQFKLFIDYKKLCFGFI